MINEIKFTKWKIFSEATDFKFNKNPGVYCFAITNEDISNKEFDWIEEIVYFGNTTSKQGLKGRLNQFENTKKGKEGHGGAKRFLNDYEIADELDSKLYISICTFTDTWDIEKLSKNDLLIKGKILMSEYVCFAEYFGKFNKLPKYNDIKNSPKAK